MPVRRRRNIPRDEIYQTFIEILRSNADERRALFSAVAAGHETRAENIEKDLYVCWMLDLLINRRPGDPIGLYFKGGTSLSKAYGLIRRFSEDIDIGIYKADLKVPLEADIAALPSANQQQKALAEQVDEAARLYISGPLKDLLTKEIAAVETESGQAGLFSLNFGYDAYREKDALDILVLGYKSVFDTSGGYLGSQNAPRQADHLERGTPWYDNAHQVMYKLKQEQCQINSDWRQPIAVKRLQCFDLHTGACRDAKLALSG